MPCSTHPRYLPTSTYQLHNPYPRKCSNDTRRVVRALCHLIFLSFNYLIWSNLSLLMRDSTIHVHFPCSKTFLTKKAATAHQSGNRFYILVIISRNMKFPPGVEFDEAGYVQYLRQQEMEYRAQVDGAIRSLGPPRHFMCGGVGKLQLTLWVT